MTLHRANSNSLEIIWAYKGMPVVLGSSCGQLVEMKLQTELVKGGQRDLSEGIDEVALNENRLRLSCLLFPGSSFNGKNRFVANQAKVTEPSFMILVPTQRG